MDPGATTSTTLLITSPVVPAGSYPIVVTATSTTDPAYAASTTVSCTVASDSPTFTDTFDRSDSPSSTMAGRRPAA